MVSSIVMGAEARSTPSYYPTMASPRYGTCVTAFLHFFDWTPAKRFSSTKRLSGPKAEKVFRRPRSLRGDHGAAGSAHLRVSESGGSDHVADGATRAPGVVARLMGLESLPQSARHHGSSQSSDAASTLPKNFHHGAPILLQDLLKRDYRAAKKKRTTTSLRDRFPAIFPRRAARDSRNKKRRSSVSLLTAFRCRPEVSCVSPAYIDIPATSRFLYSVARSPRSPFLSRLSQGSQTPLHDSPLQPLISTNLTRRHEKIPELSLQTSSTGTDVLLQGWPLGSQHIVPSDIFDDVESSSDGNSRPTSSKPIGSYKLVQGRRRGSSWNESTIEQDEDEVYWKSAARSGRRASPSSEKLESGRRRSSISSISSSDPTFKATRRSPRNSKRDADLNPRASSSRESMSTSSSLRSVSSKPPVAKLPGKSKNSASKSGRVLNSSTTKDDSHRLGKRAVAFKSKEVTGNSSPPKSRNQRSRPVADSTRTHSFLATQSGDVKQRTRRESKLVQVQDLGARLKPGNGNHGATESSHAGETTTTTTTTIMKSRSNSFHSTTHARARSVDDVFPELPFDFENSRGDSLSVPRERVLWMFGNGVTSISSPDIDFCRDCKSGQISSSPLVDFSSGACVLGRLSDALVDYDELPCLGEYYGTEGGMLSDRISSSPLIDCDELRSLAPCSAAEADSETGVREFDGCCGEVGVEDLRSEDADVVETELSGRCSGPSVSSESLLSDDVEDDRNDWSSYNNRGDCHSPRPFQVTEIDVEAESSNREHGNSSPPTEFVKKILDATGLDPLVDEAGQPSPVSILNSPFHDEACTTPESSTTDSNIHRQLLSSEEIVDELDLPPSSSATSVSNSDKIRQALLAISTFRIEGESCALAEAQVMPSSTALNETKDEQSFIRGMLSAAHFLSTPGSSPNWHDKDRVIDPSLFDKLESGDVGEFPCHASGGLLWRCDRKLLFDGVNEAFGLTRLRHCQSGQGDWLEEEIVWRSSRPRGELLVSEVVKKVEEWRMLAALAIDSLIEKDMSVHLGDWKSFKPEAAEVGLDIENKVWGEILEEIVVDMVVSTPKQY